MSEKTVITCDHCGIPVENTTKSRFTAMPVNAAYDMPTIDGCSKEHLGLALAKAFGLPIDAKAADLFVEHAKSEARRVFLETEAKRLEARIGEIEQMAARIAELEQQKALLGNALQGGAYKEWDAAITLPTKPTKPLRERLEELAAYWYRGDKDDKELNGAYRLARQECAKELREVINDPR